MRFDPQAPTMSRRTLLKTAASGFGYLAFAGLSTWAAEKSAGPLAPKPTHFPARAKRVIFMCMEGGPSDGPPSMHMKMTRLARAGKCVGFGASGPADFSAAQVERPAK